MNLIVGPISSIVAKPRIGGLKKAIFCLEENIVHVWYVSLAEIQTFFPILQSTLSEDELTRAKSYYYKKDRNKFTMRRGFLRVLLSKYLTVDAKDIQFCYGDRGKPKIVNGDTGKPVEFSISHSEDALLYAFTKKRDVGIDIEYVRPIPEMVKIVDDYFQNDEKNKFKVLPPHLQEEFFFKVWTRKEAFLKATGKGLNSLSSRLFSKTNNCQETLKRWNVRNLIPFPGFSAACAVEGGLPLKWFSIKAQNGV